jgi:DNA-binding FadR family transcriptional regulator
VPTLIREDGFEIRIYTRDHSPAHVHVSKAGANMKIDLATNQVVQIAGAISDRDVKRAEQLVAKHAQTLREAWENLHGMH